MCRCLCVASLAIALALGVLPVGPVSVIAKSSSRGAKASKAKPSAKSKTVKSTKAGKSKKSSKRDNVAKKGKGGKLSKKERERIARAAAEARRRELARLAAIKRFDDSLVEAAKANISRDDMRGEDPFVRQAAIEALGNRAGTVVVMDPNSGRVLSIVNQHMAIANAIKPCSTIKPVVALAALSENLMPESDVRILRACNCEIDMDDALAHSNNEYFQQLGRQMGLETLTTYARQFGFGERSGINLPGEIPGVLPTEVPGDGLGRVASHGDGIGITAIQLASFISTVANGGSLYQPQVVSPGKSFTPILRRQIKLDPKNRRAVLEGMVDAVEIGTARRARDSGESIAGKTGTCIGGGSWIGLFGSYSQVENPNLVVVVITRGSTARGKYAADIAGDVYRLVSSRYGNTAHRPRKIGDLDSETPTMTNR
jgi:membrane peptidoglycan carboxypeptidase